MRLAGVEARLRSPRGILALWGVTTGAVAVVALLMWRAGIPGWDDPAHTYKVYLLRHGGSVFWDDYWYGGGYGAITYGFVFYWLAQLLPAKLIAVLSAGALPPLFYLYQRAQWKTNDIWPAWALALVMCLYLAHGQDPFLLALALTLGGMVLLARGRPVVGALPVAVGIFVNPLALVVAGVLMVADFVGRPETRRRYLWFALALAPFAVARVLLGAAFTEPSSYLNETAQLMLYLGFALCGIGLAGVNAVHPRRPFVVIFLVYAVFCVVSFVTPGSPLGNNIGRFFMVFGLPLLILLRHTRLQRPFPYGDLSVVPIVLFGLLQISTAFSHFTNSGELPQTRASFFGPALAVAAQRSSPDYRIHVVALRRHWEAVFFPEAGLPITRGWYRQADAIHNSLFYLGYDAASYEAWLREMGVRYVFLPDAPLDPWSVREAHILRTSPAFDQVAHTGAWTVYRLRDAQPLAVGTDGGTARVTAFGHSSLDLRVDRPGTYLIKVTWSPYWKLERGPGKLLVGPGHMLQLEAAAAGPYALRIVVTPAAVIDQIGARLGL